MLSAKPWRREFVALFCAAQLTCFCLGQLVLGLLHEAGVAAFKSLNGFGPVLLGTLSFQGATWVLIYFFLKLHQVRWREVFGLRESGLPRTLLLVLLTVLVVFPVTQGLQQVSALVMEKIGWPPEEQTAVKLLLGAKSWWARIYLGLPSPSGEDGSPASGNGRAHRRGRLQRQSRLGTGGARDHPGAPGGGKRLRHPG